VGAVHCALTLYALRFARAQVTIRGSKRTKLGLRGMVTLGAFTQRIDAQAGRASNVVGFALAGGGAFRGALTVDATFTVASPKRCAPRAGWQASSLLQG